MPYRKTQRDEWIGNTASVILAIVLIALFAWLAQSCRGASEAEIVEKLERHEEVKDRLSTKRRRAMRDNAQLRALANDLQYEVFAAMEDEGVDVDEMLHTLERMHNESRPSSMDDAEYADTIRTFRDAEIKRSTGRHDVADNPDVTEAREAFEERFHAVAGQGGTHTQELMEEYNTLQDELGLQGYVLEDLPAPMFIERRYEAVLEQVEDR